MKRRPEPVALEHCPECSSELVYPVMWREVPDNLWEIELRCPNCEWAVRDRYRHEDVERFDTTLNRGTDRLVDACERLSVHNMRMWVGRFLVALHDDHLLPEDF